MAIDWDDLPWKDLPLENGWTSAPGRFRAQSAKDPETDEVWLKGVVWANDELGGGLVSRGSLIAKIPSDADME